MATATAKPTVNSQWIPSQVTAVRWTHGGQGLRDWAAAHKTPAATECNNTSIDLQGTDISVAPAANIAQQGCDVQLQNRQGDNNGPDRASGHIEDRVCAG